MTVCVVLLSLNCCSERAPGRPPQCRDVQVRPPSQLTLSGRALWASLPPQQVRALFPSRDAFVQRHGVGPATLPALRAVLSRVRRDGFAFEDGTVTPDFASVASPVLDPSGHPVSAIAVTSPAPAVPDHERQAIAPHGLRPARAPHHRVHRPPSLYSRPQIHPTPHALPLPVPLPHPPSPGAPGRESLRGFGARAPLNKEFRESQPSPPPGPIPRESSRPERRSPRYGIARRLCKKRGLRPAGWPPACRANLPGAGGGRTD